MAITVGPASVERWRQEQESDQGETQFSDQDPLLEWLNIFTGSPGVPQWNMDPVSDKEGFLSHVALTTAHLGHMRRVLDTPGGHMELRPAHPAPPCQCIWVTGLPGSRCLDVAVPLAHALHVPLVDVMSLVLFEEVDEATE